MSKYKFPTDLNKVKEASQQVLDELDDLKLDESEIYDVRLCFEEAFINAVKYGNKFNENLPVEVDVVKSDDHFEISVRDYGEGFDLDEAKDPTQEENLTKASGRGLFLMKKLMDHVVYEEAEKCLRMKKNIKRNEG